MVFSNGKKKLEKTIQKESSNLSYAHGRDYIEVWKPRVGQLCFSYSSHTHTNQNTQRAWVRGKILYGKEKTMEIDTFSADKNDELVNLVTEIAKQSKVEKINITSNHIQPIYKKMLEEYTA